MSKLRWFAAAYLLLVPILIGKSAEWSGLEMCLSLEWSKWWTSLHWMHWHHWRSITAIVHWSRPSKVWWKRMTKTIRWIMHVVHRCHTIIHMWIGHLWNLNKWNAYDWFQYVFDIEYMLLWIKHLFQSSHLYDNNIWLIIPFGMLRFFENRCTVVLHITLLLLAMR